MYRGGASRRLLDHVPLLLHVEDANWGPRPLRMMKCWEDYHGYSDFVCENLNAFYLEGWGGYFLQQKLNMIKFRLKDWHQQHFKNIEGKILDAKNRISSLDIRGEESEFQEEEIWELHDLSVNLHSLSRVHTSMNWQKARMNWIKEGDTNSKFFHNLMSHRQRRNSIYMVHIGGALVEGVQNIRTEVFNHFSSHFRALNVSRPGWRA